MSSNNASGKVVSVDEQAFKNADEQAVDEDGFPVVDETPAFEAAVEQATQAKVDANHPDGIADTSTERIHGVTLEQEERIRARDAELARISAQAELGTQDSREQRTREVAAEGSTQRRREFQQRAASVDPMADPERDDPRAELTQAQLAAVNKQSMRLAKQLDGWSRAAISRRLAEAVVDGTDMASAVVGVFEELQTAPGTVVPIGKLEDVNRKEVSIEGQVETLWDPSHPSIAQVGLIADDSGRTGDVRDRLVVDENAESQDDLEPRTKRAVAEAMDVSRLSKGGRYEVQSASGNRYEVDVIDESCTCPD